MPFEVAGDVSIIGNADLVRANWKRTWDFGPLVGSSLFWLDGDDTPTRLRQVALHAVAALPDRVAVVFFAAPDGVLTLAHGGLDVPWTRQVLDPGVTRGWVGSLDAVTLPDGKVAIAVRQRLRPSLFFTWSIDGTVTREVLPLTTNDHWSYSRCPDVWMDVAPNGTLALVWGTGRGVGFITRPAGSTTWSANDPPPITAPPNSDIGCVNRVAFDGNGFAQVLSLVRKFPFPVPTEPEPYDPNLIGEPPAAYTDPKTLPLGLLGRSVPTLDTVGHARRADGRWYAVGGAQTPVQRFPIPHPYHPGFLTLATHPAGFVFSGASLSLGKPHFTYQLSSLTHRSQGLEQFPNPKLIKAGEFVNNVFDISYRTSTTGEMYPDPWSLRLVAVSTAATFTQCGATLLHGPGSYRDIIHQRPFNVGRIYDCLVDPQAPLNQSERFDLPELGYPVMAHGRKPYEVGFCLYGNTLELCHGGFDGLPRVVDEGPTLLSSVPANGSVIPAELRRVTLTLDRPLQAEETIQVSRANVTVGAEEVMTLAGSGPTFEVEVPAFVEPGQVLRLALEVRSPGVRHVFVRRPPPVVQFTMAGAQVVDPRLVPTPPACFGTRTDTACELSTLADRLVGPAFTIALDYDFEARDLGMPVVFNQNGTRNRDVTVTRARSLFSSRFDFAWTAAQPPGAKFTVLFPVDLVDGHGTVMPEPHRRFIVTTGP